MPNPPHLLSDIDLDAMTADCKGCGNRVVIRKLNSLKRPVCEPKLMESRRARRKRQMETDRAGYNAYHRTYGRVRKYGLTVSLDELLEGRRRTVRDLHRPTHPCGIHNPTAYEAAGTTPREGGEHETTRHHPRCLRIPRRHRSRCRTRRSPRHHLGLPHLLNPATPPSQ